MLQNDIFVHFFMVLVGVCNRIVSGALHEIRSTNYYKLQILFFFALLAVK